MIFTFFCRSFNIFQAAYSVLTTCWVIIAGAHDWHLKAGKRDSNGVIFLPVTYQLFSNIQLTDQVRLLLPFNKTVIQTIIFCNVYKETLILMINYVPYFQRRNICICLFGYHFFLKWGFPEFFIEDC